MSLTRSGRGHFGKADLVVLPITKRERFTTTFFLLVFYLPLIPVGTYRIERLKRSWREKIIILEKLPINWEQVLKAWVVTAAILLAIMTAVRIWIRSSTR